MLIKTSDVRGADCKVVHTLSSDLCVTDIGCQGAAGSVCNSVHETVPESSAAGVLSRGSDCVMLSVHSRDVERERRHFKRSAQMSPYQILSIFSQKAPGDSIFLN